MKNREQFVSWVLAFAVFSLIVILLANYRLFEPMVFGYFKYWEVFGVNSTPNFLFFLFLFPALYLLARRLTSSEILKNVLLINSFLLPVYFFVQFVGISENLFFPSYLYLEMPDLDNLWFQGMQPSWFPFFLLVTVLIVLMALVATFSEKLELLKNSYFLWSLALSIAMLFFLECSLIAYGVYNSHRLMTSHLIGENCIANVSAVWTPEYIEGLKPELLQEAEEHVRYINSGEIRISESEKALGSEYWKYNYLRSRFRSLFRRQCQHCFYERVRESGFPGHDIVTALLFIPASIASVLFSLKVFKRKGFINPVLEKAFLIAAIPLWFWGIILLLEPSFITGAFGVGYDSPLYLVLSTLTFIISIAILLPIAHWLGWRPKFLKRK